MSRAWEVLFLVLAAIVVIDFLYAAVQTLFPILVGAMVAVHLFSRWYRRQRWW